jgi:hypothetical protein
MTPLFAFSRPIDEPEPVRFAGRPRLPAMVWTVSHGRKPMQTKITWKVRVLSLALICVALLALSLPTDISTIGATGRFAWNAVMAALLTSARSFDTVLACDPGYRDPSGELWVSVFEPVLLERTQA